MLLAPSTRLHRYSNVFVPPARGELVWAAPPNPREGGKTPSEPPQGLPGQRRSPAGSRMAATEQMQGLHQPDRVLRTPFDDPPGNDI